LEDGQIIGRNHDVQGGAIEVREKQSLKTGRSKDKGRICYWSSYKTKKNEETERKLVFEVARIEKKSSEKVEHESLVDEHIVQQQFATKNKLEEEKKKSLEDSRKEKKLR
jgi:hypothetical protein